MTHKRNRINANLVGTTSLSETKRRYAKSNASKKTKYTMFVFGIEKEITEEQYKTLKEIGYGNLKVE